MAGTLASDVEAVVLDVGGVLLLPDPAAFREHLAPFGVCPSDEECVRAHYAGMAVVDECGEGDFVQADRAIARLFGVEEEHVDAAAAEIHAAYSKRFVPSAGAAEQLLRLRTAGVALAVISNTTGDWPVEASLVEHGICGLSSRSTSEALADVAVIVESHLVGIEKPDPAIFALALEVLEVAPERCMYVGDSVHFDVNGAIAAGLRPVHVTSLTGCGGDHPHYASLRPFVDAFLGG